MSWQNPRTWSTGELVTAAMLNQDIRDNMNALHDQFDDVTSSKPSRALDIVYQNDSGKIRVVCVSVLLAGGSDEAAAAYTDANTPPTTRVAHTRTWDASREETMTFIVAPGHYYYIDSAVNSPSLEEWAEWDLL
jgi:hypothetical protein